jgi:hypothetical protein
MCWTRAWLPNILLHHWLRAQLYRHFLFLPLSLFLCPPLLLSLSLSLRGALHCYFISASICVLGLSIAITGSFDIIKPSIKMNTFLYHLFFNQKLNDFNSQIQHVGQRYFFCSNV